MKRKKKDSPFAQLFYMEAKSYYMYFSENFSCGNQQNLSLRWKMYKQVNQISDSLVKTSVSVAELVICIIGIYQ